MGVWKIPADSKSVNTSIRQWGKSFWVCWVCAMPRIGLRLRQRRQDEQQPTSSNFNVPRVLESVIRCYTGWWFQTFFPFHGCHPSHWRTHIFQDGYCTTNQDVKKKTGFGDVLDVVRMVKTIIRHHNHQKTSFGYLDGKKRPAVFVGLSFPIQAQALQVQVQKTIRQVHPGLLQAMGQMGRQGDSAVTFLIWGGFLLK